MSAIGILESPQPQLGIWATKDPMLACTLGTLGFPARGTLPIAIIHDARKIAEFSKKGITDSGRIKELSSTEVSFVYEISHPAFGKLNCSQVFYAHQVALLRHKKQVSELDFAENAQLEDLVVRLKRSGLDNTVVYLIHQLYDQICNWSVLCDAIQELSKNPFLRFAKNIKNNGVAYALNPLEVEDTAARRSERIYKSTE